MSGWAFAAATVALAGLLDVAFGEPPDALHPVAWMGRLIAVLERRRPRGRPRAELAYGALIVVASVRTVAGRRPCWLFVRSFALPVCGSRCRWPPWC